MSHRFYTKDPLNLCKTNPLKIQKLSNNFFTLEMLLIFFPGREMEKEEKISPNQE